MTLPRIADLYAGTIALQVSEASPIIDRLDMITKQLHAGVLATTYSSDLKKPQKLVEQIYNIILGLKPKQSEEAARKISKKRMASPYHTTMAKIKALKAQKGGGGDGNH